MGKAKGRRKRDGRHVVVSRGMEDWNEFISGGMTFGEAKEGEVVAELRPGEPVTPQLVLRLNSSTKGELAF